MIVRQKINELKCISSSVIFEQRCLENTDEPKKQIPMQISIGHAKCQRTNVFSVSQLLIFANLYFSTYIPEELVFVCMPIKISK